NAGPDYFYDITFPVGNVVSQEMTGEITYQSREEKGQQVLLASLQLRNSRQGSPFGNEKVEYAFRKGLEEYTGRGVTDASGRLEPLTPSSDCRKDRIVSAASRPAWHSQPPGQADEEFPSAETCSRTDIPP